MKKTITVLNAQALTVSGNSSGYSVKDFIRAKLNVDVTAVTGTGPTLVIKVTDSYDNTTYFHNTILTDKDRQGNLTRLTAPTDEAKITTVSKHVCWIENLADYLRLEWELGGTTPSFTTTAVLTLYSE